MATVSFEVVTNDICKTWDKAGKSKIEKVIQDHLDGGSSIYDCIKKPTDLRMVIYEVTYQALLGRFKTENLNQLISSFKEKDENFCSDVVDVWSLIDVELNAIDDRKKLKEKFHLLVSYCSKETIDAALLKERFDVETLKDLRLIGDTKTFQQKYIKTKTRLFYKQQKFNLLREEMEGYSKLITELGDLNDKKVDPDILLEIVKSLIGCFNIDPNRVLDLLLESFECHPEFSKCLFVPVLREYLQLCEKSTLCHLLGFKFSHYQQKGEATPSSLYTLAALLIQNNLVSLDGLLPHLTPDDESLKSKWNKYVDEVKEEARRTTVMVLNPQDKKEDKEAKIQPDDVANQKFGLCEALLKIGDWNDAMSILNSFEVNHVITCKPIASALCELVSYLVDPIYTRNCSGYKPTCPRVPSYHCARERVERYDQLESRDVFAMLQHLGPKASTDPLLLVKMIRIGKAFLNQYYASPESKKQEWKRIFGNMLGMISDVILPSLSLIVCNPNLSYEVWDLIKLLPYQIRYRLYGDWKNECYDKHPELMLARASVIDKTKYIMRRLTKENVKQTGRQMGKLSHSSPTILFDSILSQIQRYDNLIGPVVDALKYLTDLTYDCLSFCIIEALANPQKERMKHDDTNISNWLQSLASFCGNILKKYNVELSGLLQYVANQLKAGKSLDLLIMKEVVQKMSGIEISEEVTNDQLEALHGGELLRNEAGYFGQIRNQKKSSNRLKDSLIGQNLALPLCVLMAQQRHGIVFSESKSMHLKLMGKLTDQCHDTLVQFGNFLSIQLGTEEYNKRFPSIEILTSQYHTPPDAAFFLTKPMYSYQIATKYDELRKQDRSKPRGMVNGGGDKTTHDKTQRYIAASDAVIGALSEQVQSMHGPRVWMDISPRFYTTFWTLSLYDLQVPGDAYVREIAKLKQNIGAIESDAAHGDGRKRREKERQESLISKLKDEEKKQEEHHARVRARLKHERDQWFLAKTTKNDTITKFLQLCIFPRSIFSALDAVYCAKMIHILHQLKTNNFSTLLCFDRIFTDISYTIASLTENESSRYGRFLCCMLAIIKKWHADKSVYEKECGSYPGFMTVLREKAGTKADQLDYENFRHVCHKWQYKLTKAIVVCLESQEFCQIRNALVILTKILPHFPAVTSLASALEKRIDKIRGEEKEKRPDLYALAMGYSGLLKGRKGSLVAEHLYHNKATSKSSGASKSADKNKEDRSSKDKNSLKRKSEDKSVRPPKEAKVSDRSKSKESHGASSGDGGDLHKKSSSKKMPPPVTTSDNVRESSRSRRSKNATASAAAADTASNNTDASNPRSSSKDRHESKKKDDGDKRSSVEGGKESKRSISKERKRELPPSPTQANDSKRHRSSNNENGAAVSRHSKEKESKTRRNEGKPKKDHQNNTSESKKERNTSKERTNRRG